MPNDTARPRFPSATLRVDEPTQRVRPAEKAREHMVLNVLAGPSAGALFVLEQAETVLGRDPGNRIAIPDVGVSSNHARIVLINDAFVLEDLRSTNGTFVNGARLETRHALADGDRIQLGQATVIGVRLQDEAELAASRRLYDSVVRDVLTGVYNRRHFEERLTAEWAFATRHRTPLAVIMIDVDHFKRVNDTYGHLAGDAALRVVGSTLSYVLRAEDLAARFGGEEFVVIARGIDRNRARMLADRLRSAIETCEVVYEGTHIRITASLGVSVTTPDKPMVDGPSLVAAADAALYRAKNQGRNQVAVAE
jgi:two-component system cell cycle response regulator